MSLLSHDRYQYDSLILSKQSWAYPHQHLQQLLWCVVSFRLNLPEVEERKLCLWYTPTRRNHKELSLDLLHNVESVYLFYNNPVLQDTVGNLKLHTTNILTHWIPFQFAVYPSVQFPTFKAVHLSMSSLEKWDAAQNELKLLPAGINECKIK